MVSIFSAFANGLMFRSADKQMEPRLFPVIGQRLVARMMIARLNCTIGKCR